MAEANDLGYWESDADNVRLLGNRILVDWEFHQDELQAGKVLLARPDTHNKMKYTGVIVKVGNRVFDDDYQVGRRIFFDQFSDFEKFWDAKYGRWCILDIDNQGAAFAIIPERMKIGGETSEYNFEN